MPLPETIPVKYTEEDAGFISVRPVVKQTFTLHELLDMVLAVTGKDAERVVKVLRSGTVVFHFYRYKWQGFEAPRAELDAALGAFPDADPARVFHAEHCTAVLLDTGSHSPPDWKRRDASARRFLHRRSFWDELMGVAAAASPAYHSYSYEHRADIFTLPLAPALAAQIAASGERLLPAAARGPLASLPKARKLLFVCPRR